MRKSLQLALAATVAAGLATPLSAQWTEWLTKPTILSYHTLWFQLHEDLLATLGLERAAETVRLNGEPTTEPPGANPDPTETTR